MKSKEGTQVKGGNLNQRRGFKSKEGIQTSVEDIQTVEVIQTSVGDIQTSIEDKKPLPFRLQKEE